ncbi:hypothetical protein HYZ70_01805 [Candidatus Curtissbacteria bacterium]|nr:hypothetical protein [Candidatus Curtissbacteria bacterium]
MDKLSDIARLLYGIFGAAVINLFLSGGVLIFLVWISENWIKTSSFVQTRPLNFFGLNLNNILFVLGFTLILLALIWLFLQWLVFQARIFYYNFRYPIKQQDQSYFLVLLRGTGYLVDGSYKEIRWVENAIAAADLKMGGRWTYFDKTLLDLITQEGSIAVGLGKQVNLEGYSWGKGIRTRGIPGT